ncbi:MAG: signal peptidase I [Clostridia bacterium]|nr:signal peptidase I [Clostridia bacterium]
MTKEKTSTTHKVLTIIGSILCVILIPILIINITLIAKSYINKDEVPSIGGMVPLIVLTDSMVPEIYSGDLIICKAADAEDIKVNDVISFFDPVGNGTSIVTHRVIEILEDDGEIFFRTRGDNNNTEDKELVPAENLVGVYKMRIAGAGHIAMFMQSTAGLIICVVLPIILLVGYDIIRRRIYEKNNKQDTDTLLAELEALRAEKAEKEKVDIGADNSDSTEN